MMSGAKTIMAFLLLAIFVRSLVPAGFMPDHKSSSVFAMTICSGLAMKTIFVKGSDGHGQKSAMDVCPFSLTLLAEKFHAFDIADYIRVSYAPVRAAHEDFTARFYDVKKPYLSQGPPVVPVA